MNLDTVNQAVFVVPAGGGARRAGPDFAAALQYVRKVSGYTKPSQANTEAFERAVATVAEATAQLMADLTTNAPPRDREAEIAKRRAANAKRFGRT